MELHDYDAERALADLVDRATTQRLDAVDPDLLKRIKSSCKTSEAAIRTVYDLLYTRLKKPHSQVRLLALDISAELFPRSALFRSLLAAKFPQFLNLVLGFKTNEPLPAPTDTAGRLRQRALELIEKWHSEYGTRYPQLALGYSYIRDTLRFEFPQLDARREAEADAERVREARAQQIAQQRYQSLLAEWQSQAVECRSLLTQFSEAFALLDKEAPNSNPGRAFAGNNNTRNSNVHEQEDDQQWEDVDDAEKEKDGNAVDGGGGSGVQLAAEGLAAYAALADDDQEHPLQNTDKGNASNNDTALLQEEIEINSALESVIEMLDGLYKLICSRALPGIQEALRIIVRAEAGVPGEAQHAQRERLLRAAISIKSELTAAKERFEGAHLDLAALAQAQARRREQREERRKKAQQSQQLKKKNTSKEEEEKSNTRVINPYHYIKDPAAPRKPFLAPGHIDFRSSGAGSGKSSINIRASGTGQMNIAPHLQQKIHQQQATRPNTSSNPSSLPESVRQSLASRAPILPAGPFIRVWDSNTASGTAAPQFINSNGLEVANHWGPVDVHTELPSERMEEMFLYAPAQLKNYAGSGGGGKSGGDTNVNNEDAANKDGQSDRMEEANRGGGGRKSGVPPGRAPVRNNTNTNISANNNNTTTSTNATIGSSLLHGGFIPSTTTEGRRAQRAAERAYNDAVISAAAVGGDEALAQALETGGSLGGASGSGNEQQERGRKKRKAGGAGVSTTRDRLEKKLLSSSARAAALADSTAAENERQREKFSNRWENR